MADFLRSPGVNALAVALMVAVAGVHFYQIAHYAVDLPFADDFHLLKNVVWTEQRNLGFAEAFREAYVQHNEHRILFPRLYTFLDFWLEGRINWLTLTWFGTLFVLGFVALFYRSFPKQGVTGQRLPLVFFVPVALFLFQPQSYDSLTWTISILQQYCVFFWLFLLAVLVAKPGRGAFAGAVAVAVIAVFTHGNGILGFAWGAVVLALQRRWKTLGFWLAALAVVAACYFGFGYAKGQNGDAAGSLSQPLRFVGGVFAFLGAFADAFKPDRLALPIALGAMMTLTLAYVNVRAVWAVLKPGVDEAIWQKYLRDDRFFLMGCFALLFATGLITSLFRSWNGLQSLVEVRYIHMSALAFIVFYLTLLHVLSRRLRNVLLVVVLVFSGLFWLVAQYGANHPLDHRRSCQWADAFNWRHNESFVQYPNPFVAEIRPTYGWGVRQGVCPLPPTPFDAAEPALLGPAPVVDSSLRVRVTASELLVPEPNAVRRFSQFDFVSNNGKGPQFVVLKSETNVYLVGTWRGRNTWQRVLTTFSYYGTGFSGSVVSGTLRPGTYRVGVLSLAGGLVNLRFSPQTLTVS